MRLVAGCVAVVTFTAGVARAESKTALDACVGPSIVLEPPLARRRSWSDAAGDARRRVAELPGVDACARLEVEQTKHSVRVRASASDGRSVVRDLASPGELEPTVVALLVLPPDTERPYAFDGAAAPASKADAGSATTSVQKPTPAPERPPPSAPKPSGSNSGDRASRAPELAGASARQSSFEVALGPAARANGYLLGAGGSVLLDWRLGGWLFGTTLGGEQVSDPSPATGRFSVQRSASVAPFFGRRLVRSPFYLDVGVLAPMLVVSSAKWTTLRVRPASSGDDAGEAEGASDDGTSTTTTSTVSGAGVHTDLRAGALARLVLPFSGAFGVFVALDAERSLLSAKAAPGEPAPLAWGFGGSLGLLWGSR